MMSGTDRTDAHPGGAAEMRRAERDAKLVGAQRKEAEKKRPVVIVHPARGLR